MVVIADVRSVWSFSVPSKTDMDAAQCDLNVPAWSPNFLMFFPRASRLYDRREGWRERKVAKSSPKCPLSACKGLISDESAHRQGRMMQLRQGYQVTHLLIHSKSAELSSFDGNQRSKHARTSG